MRKSIKKLGLFSYLSLFFCLPTYAQFRPDRPTFFDDGQKFMEQEIKNLESQQQNNNNNTNQQNIEHPSQLLTVNDGKLSWQKYIFQEAGFSVWMPSATSSEETVKINTSAGEIPFQVFATQPKSLRFITAYSNSSNIPNIGNQEAILMAVKNGIIKHTNFTLVTNQDISFSGYPAQYLVMKNSENNEVIYFNIYLIKNQIYVLGAGTTSNDYEKDINSFFGSFRLL